MYIYIMYIYICIHIYIWCVRLCRCIFMCIEHAKKVSSANPGWWICEASELFCFPWNMYILELSELAHLLQQNGKTAPLSVAGDGLVGIRLQLLLSLLRQQWHAGWRSVGDHHRTGPHAILYLGGSAGMILDESWISWEVNHWLLWQFINGWQLEF